jgi:hypothetical protein
LIPIMLRASEEWKAGVLEAATKLRHARGDKEKGIVHFIRQAVTKEVNRVLEKRPTLPCMLQVETDTKSARAAFLPRSRRTEWIAKIPPSRRQTYQP